MARWNEGKALGFLFLSVLVVTVTSQRTFGKCEPYNYCNGISLDAATVLLGRTIYCDTVSDPKHRCCLPQTEHVVCYDIIVDGQFLSYDPSGRSPSTDFSALCEAIAKQRGRHAGKYTSVVTAEGGGYLAYRRGSWVAAEARSQHIKHLACGLD
ncbi:hypothetical protein NP493_146g00000 [Ridgeia piscesae]|uniref:Uncharacterized protein n=1 Tax=Ridgeia piscesae TaxID=27915 RepID=A0AAD9P4I1_RIDPI|nr:hypothetical protein NP493_146g00000 [Ridgeia piscesae]